MGERENRKVTQRAKDLFLKRRKEKFFNTDPVETGKNGQQKRFNKGRRNKSNMRELRRPDEILKLKKGKAR